jgi:hypothetical protein
MLSKVVFLLTFPHGMAIANKQVRIVQEYLHGLSTKGKQEVREICKP